MADRSPTTEGVRVATCGAVGALTGAAISVATTWQLALLAAWTVTGTLLLVWIWLDVHTLDAAATAATATREDSSRTATRALLIGASTMSLGAVVVGLRRAAAASVAVERLLTIASMTTVITAWLVVHTMYVLRYAHLYYGGDRVGGIDFPGGELPDYGDFAYFGFTIGMTFQVSDTAVTDRVLRRTVLRHALLAFVFGTAIVATTINVLAGLIR